MECEREGEGEAGDKTTLICTILRIDHTHNLFYRVCAICERTLPDSSSLSCQFCKFSSGEEGGRKWKRLFRVLISIATDAKVFTAICFDRAARVLFGCSADEFFNFAKLHPFAALDTSSILEGEMFRMTLSKPKNGYAQHQRVVSVIPLRSGFQPALETLKELNRGQAGS